jgi:hypothetical protein
MAKPDFTRTALEVGDVDLVNTRLFGKVDLPPTVLFAKFPDSLTKLGAHIRGHSSSIDLVEALYLVDALSGEQRGKSGGTSPVWLGGLAALSTVRTRRERHGVILRQEFNEIFSQKH